VRRHLTYANVMSTLGVFLALAGGYAVAKISGDGSIRGGQATDIGADRETLVTVPGLGKATTICLGDETRAAWKNTSGGRERVTVEFDTGTASFLSQSGSSHEYSLETGQPKLTFHVAAYGGTGAPQTIVSVIAGGASDQCAERVAAEAITAE
jgi:hypothetical protein